MPNQPLTSVDMEILPYKNIESGNEYPFVFTLVANSPYLLAKSVVIGAIEMVYRQNEDQYISKFMELFDNDIKHFDLDADKSLVRQVWRHARGHFNNVIFVKASTLLPRLKEVFPELPNNMIKDITSQLHYMIVKLS
jgi:hypothetical protein